MRETRSSAIFLTDENVNGEAIRQLQARGIEIRRVQDPDINLRNSDDELILAFAWEHGLILVTGDQDHHDMHYRWLGEERDHYGIVFIPDRNYRNIGMIVEHLTAIAEATQRGDFINMLWRLE